MSNIDVMDLVELEDRTTNSNLRPVDDLLVEWENLISELSNKEVMLYHKKTDYQRKSDEIIAETNFKELYGANNQKVRDNHVKTVLSKDYETIKALEFSIDWINRRISFLRELVKTKRVLMEVKQ